MIKGIEKLPYEVRLTVLELPTLEERRRKIDFVQAFKIWRDFDHVQSQLFNKVSDSHDKSTPNASGENFVVNKSNLNLRRHFFSNRIVKDWNALPLGIEQSQTVQAFKAGLNKYLTSH